MIEWMKHEFNDHKYKYNQSSCGRFDLHFDWLTLLSFYWLIFFLLINCD